MDPDLGSQYFSPEEFATSGRWKRRTIVLLSVLLIVGFALAASTTLTTDELYSGEWWWPEDGSGQFAGAVAGHGLGTLFFLYLFRAFNRRLRARGRNRGLRATASFDVSADAREIRWLGRSFGVLQAGGFVLLPNAFILALGPLDEVFSVPGGVMVPIVGFVLATMAASRMFATADGGRSSWQRSAVRSLRALLFRILAIFFLLVGLFALSTTAVQSASWSIADTGVRRTDPAAQEVFILLLSRTVVSLAAISIASILFRYARRFQLADGDQLGLPAEQVTLLLRSFEDDSTRLAASASARRGMFDAWTVRATDRFEEIVTWEVAAYGPVVAVSDKKSLGAARIRLRDQDWQDWVGKRVASAPLLVVVLGSSEGLGWEIDRLITAGALDKTVFVIPPVTRRVAQERWRWFVSVAESAGLEVDPNASIEDCLSYTLTDSGEVITYSSDRLDEASYRAATRRAARSLHLLKAPLHRAPSEQGFAGSNDDWSTSAHRRKTVLQVAAAFVLLLGASLAVLDWRSDESRLRDRGATDEVLGESVVPTQTPDVATPTPETDSPPMIVDVRLERDAGGDVSCQESRGDRWWAVDIVILYEDDNLDVARTAPIRFNIGVNRRSTTSAVGTEADSNLDGALRVGWCFAGAVRNVQLVDLRITDRSGLHSALSTSTHTVSPPTFSEAAPTPEPTDMPASLVGRNVRLLANGVLLRSGPDLNAQALVRIDGREGDRFEVLAERSNGWIRITVDSRSGWIFGSFVDPAPPGFAVARTRDATPATLRTRTGAILGSENASGSFVLVEDMSGSYWRVLLPDQSTAFVQPREFTVLSDGI